MILLSLAIWLHWTSSAALADQPCASAASQADLQGALQRAETAFSALDVETFTRSMDDAIFLVPCLAEPVDVAQIARLHRLQGIRQFVANEEERAVQSFAAARATEPDYQLPLWLVPDGSALRDLYGRMPVENGTKVPVPAPVSGTIRFDGVPGLERPTSWSSFVQVLDANGRVVATAYLFPGDAMPAYAAVKEPVAASGSASGSHTPHKLGVGLVSACVGSALGAGLLYGLAANSAANFEASHPDWDESDLVASRSQTNDLVISSGALGVIAAGLGLSAAFVVKW